MLKFKDIIVHEDEDYIIVNKPYDLSTLEDRDKTKSYILKMAKEYWADAQVCHRLDKETSGILAIAKNPDAYRHLAMQFEHRKVIKVYHAVVKGTRVLQNQEFSAPIEVQKDGIVRLDKMGKEAATIFNTLEIFGKYSLVGCFPITGRMHQIRVHLSALGLPIVADLAYGGEYVYLSALKRNVKLKKWTEEQPLMSRVALHAKNITFKDLRGIEHTFDAPYSKDMTALLRQLEKNCK